MPKGYPALSQEQKKEIISRIKDKGERAADLAKEYGVVPKTIYNLLNHSVHGSRQLLEYAKLKREHEALLKIVGELLVDQKLGKKIKQSYGR